MDTNGAMTYNVRSLLAYSRYASGSMHISIADKYHVAALLLYHTPEAYTQNISGNILASLTIMPPSENTTFAVTPINSAAKYSGANDLNLLSTNPIDNLAQFPVTPRFTMLFAINIPERMKKKCTAPAPRSGGRTTLVFLPINGFVWYINTSSANTSRKKSSS